MVLLLSGVCNAGELPGHLITHPGEGGPGQAPLLHPPDVPRQGRILRGSVCTSGLDRVRDGIHQKVRRRRRRYTFKSSTVGQPIIDLSPSASLLSWFWGPVVTLQDCLAAFFARDELKGERVGGGNLSSSVIALTVV